MNEKTNRWICMLILCVYANDCLGQDTLKNHILDTILVETSKLDKYLAGVKIIALNGHTLHQSNGQSLSYALMKHSPVYVKEYGNGMLGSISFRGTGSSHTVVLWNGININSLTAGGSDYGTLPVFGFENIDIQCGSASSLYGSDAIGGVIHLNSKNQHDNKLRVSLQQNFGSFGTFFTGLKLHIKQNKWRTSTKIYHAYSKNNFLFRNTAKIGHPKERQTHAETKNYGVAQRFSYHFNSRNILETEIWLHRSERNLAHTMVRVGEKGGEMQEDQNLRFSMQYTKHIDWGSFYVTSGFVADRLNYNNLSDINTNRFIFGLEYETELSKNMTMRLGSKLRKITSDVDNYGKVITESRNDLFGLLRWNIFRAWHVSLHARQAYVTGFSAPFSPALGSDFSIFDRRNQRLIFKNLVSRSYRVPTLNDRYWKKGGNPNILPENGWMLEVGLAYQRKKERLHIKSELTHFRMWVQNWIVWRPTAQFWTPMNIQKVQSTGLEFSGNIKYLFSRWSWNTGVNYALTKSINKKKLHEYDRSLNKQLIYTPLHRATAFTELTHKKWIFDIHYQYTSKRYTLTDHTEFIAGFGLWDMSVSKNYILKNHQFKIGLQTRNILNTYYQNLQNYAMPSRQFLLHIKYSYRRE